MYATIGTACTKAKSDAKYSTTSSGGLSASGFTMTGDINMDDNKILKLTDPTTSKSATNKNYVLKTF